MRLYSQTLSAIKDFRQEILDRSKKVVESNLSDLASAIDYDLNPTKIVPYKYEHPEGKWIASRIVLEKYGINFYFGMIWKVNPHRQIDSQFVVTVMDVRSKDKASVLLDFARKCNTLSRSNRICLYLPHEVALDEEIRYDDFHLFEQTLEGLIKEWIKIWKAFGGTRALGFDATSPKQNVP
ncbi:hypothetical protein W02_02990 [Nitrospira sp. KM1]|nr:hypothetical protein W02_02990 [Nitrospira sp. KM1]